MTLLHVETRFPQNDSQHRLAVDWAVRLQQGKKRKKKTAEKTPLKQTEVCVGKPRER